MRVGGTPEGCIHGGVGVRATRHIERLFSYSEIHLYRHSHCSCEGPLTWHDLFTESLYTGTRSTHITHASYPKQLFKTMFSSKYSYVMPGPLNLRLFSPHLALGAAFALSAFFRGISLMLFRGISLLLFLGLCLLLFSGLSLLLFRGIRLLLFLGIHLLLFLGLSLMLFLGLLLVLGLGRCLRNPLLFRGSPPLLVFPQAEHRQL